MTKNKINIILLFFVSMSGCQVLTEDSSDTDTMLNINKFKDLFNDLPYEPGFMAKHKVSKLTISKEGKPVEIHTFNKSGQPATVTRMPWGDIHEKTEYHYQNTLLVKKVSDKRFRREINTTIFEYKGDELVKSTMTIMEDEPNKLVPKELQKDTHISQYQTTRKDGKLVEKIEKEIKPSYTGPQETNYQILYQYDGKGNLTKKTVIINKKRIIPTTFHYNDKGQRTEIKREGSYSDAKDRYIIQYDQHGRISKITFFENGKEIVARIYNYNKHGLLTSRRQTSQVPAMGSSLLMYSYEYFK